MHFSQQVDKLFLPAAKLMFSLAECVPWLAVLLILPLAIIILNLITIIVFIKSRSLRKRSTYLMINLAVADMLVGVIATDDFSLTGVNYCNLWEDIVPDKLAAYMTFFSVLFPVASVTNISAISLERLHATFLPIKHRVMQKWSYGLIIAITWVTAGLVSIGAVLLDQFKERSRFFYLWISFNLICLLFISVSYVSIVIKVRCGAQPHRHGAASRERKLTMTLFIVTFVSLVTWFPFVIYNFLYYNTAIFSSVSQIANVRLGIVTIVLYHANSFVNPILYAARMPDFRRTLAALFRRRPQQVNSAPVIPLRDMWSNIDKKGPFLPSYNYSYTMKLYKFK